MPSTLSEPSKKLSIRMPMPEEDEQITQAAANDPDALPLREEQMNQMASLRDWRGCSRLADKKQLA
jgi:hypothetical protein